MSATRVRRQYAPRSGREVIGAIQNLDVANEKNQLLRRCRIGRCAWRDGRLPEELTDRQLVDVIKWYESRPWHDGSEILCGIMGRDQLLAAIEMYEIKHWEYCQRDGG